MTDDELIQRIGAERLAEMAGLKLSGSRRPERDTHCPWHADENPSAQLNLETGLLYCFVCNRGVNLIQLYAEHRQVDLQAARRELLAAETIGVRVVNNEKGAKQTMQRRTSALAGKDPGVLARRDPAVGVEVSGVGVSLPLR